MGTLDMEGLIGAGDLVGWGVNGTWARHFPRPEAIDSGDCVDGCAAAGERRIAVAEVGRDRTTGEEGSAGELRDVRPVIGPAVSMPNPWLLFRPGP